MKYDKINNMHYHDINDVVYINVYNEDITNDMREEMVGELVALQNDSSVLRFATPTPNSAQGYLKYNMEEIRALIVSVGRLDEE